MPNETKSAVLPGSSLRYWSRSSPSGVERIDSTASLPEAGDSGAEKLTAGATAMATNKAAGISVPFIWSNAPCRCVVSILCQLDHHMPRYGVDLERVGRQILAVSGAL